LPAISTIKGEITYCIILCWTIFTSICHWLVSSGKLNL